jgi:hypothetical protein
MLFMARPIRTSAARLGTSFNRLITPNFAARNVDFDLWRAGDKSTVLQAESCRTNPMDGTDMDALDALEHERDPLRTACLLLLEIEIERLRRMRLH